MFNNLFITQGNCKFCFLGQEVCADFNGWNLYLKDMKATADIKMNNFIASQLGSQVYNSKKSSLFIIFYYYIKQE